MRIDFGNFDFNLEVKSNKTGIQETYQGVIFESARAWEPDRFGIAEQDGLEARQREDSSFIGKIGINGFYLTPQGFEVRGIACKENGEADYEQGGQHWIAIRGPELT